MFELSRRYIKPGFIFFIVGLLLGLYMIISIYILGNWPQLQLITAHVYVLLFGFLLALIMGVAIWMFPRTADQKHYSPKLAEVTYRFLTLGTTTRFIGEVISYYIIFRMVDWIIVLGGISQVLAGFLFIYNMWSRVRPVGKQV